MQKKELVYQRVYNDFRIRLCEGEFPLGSAVPSLPDLCRQYNVGKNTILKVLRMLKENGFIATAPGKVGQVLFDCNKLSEYLIDLPGFICDKDILLDYYQAIRILLPPIYTYASLSCTDEHLMEIKKLALKFHAGNVDSETYIHLSIHLFQTILAATENQLLTKIVEITMRKTILPGALLCGHNKRFKPLLMQGAATTEALYAALQQKNKVQLKACWVQLLTIYPAILEKALEFGIFPDTPACETDLFQEMDIEKCFIVAHTFRHKILRGEYIQGDFLPAIAASKEQFKVSAITIRTAYQILGEMGFAQTINGRGTQVIPFSLQKNPTFLSQFAIQRKQNYLEAIAFLEITCEEIVEASKHISFSALRHDIDSQWNPSHLYSVMIVFYHIFKGANSPAVLAIYQANSNHLYWGTYLQDVPAIGSSSKNNHLQCLKVIDALEQQDRLTATSMLLQLLKTLYPRA